MLYSRKILQNCKESEIPLPEAQLSDIHGGRYKGREIPLLLLDNTFVPFLLEWASSKGKMIIGDFKIELVQVLKEKPLRRYFEKYITADDNRESVSLFVWRETKSILQVLEKYKTSSQLAKEDLVTTSVSSVSNSGLTSSSPTAASCPPTPPTASPAMTQLQSLFNLRPRIQKSSVFLSSSSSSSSSITTTKSKRTSTETEGNTSTAPTASALDAELGETYCDPYKALKIALRGVRSLYQKFFQIPPSPSPSSPSHSKVLSSLPSTPPPQHALTGVVESTRLDLAATLDMTSNIRDVETLELVFARACLGRLERILRSIEKQTLQKLQSYYPSFLQSDQFVLLAADRLARSSPSIQAHLRSLRNLQQINAGGQSVQKTAASSSSCPSSNVLYVPYEVPPVELVDRAVKESTDGNALFGGEGRVELPIIAISLDVYSTEVVSDWSLAKLSGTQFWAVEASDEPAFDSDSSLSQRQAKVEHSPSPSSPTENSDTQSAVRGVGVGVGTDTAYLKLIPIAADKESTTDAFSAGAEFKYDSSESEREHPRLSFSNSTTNDCIENALCRVMSSCGRLSDLLSAVSEDVAGSGLVVSLRPSLTLSHVTTDPILIDAYSLLEQLRHPNVNDNSKAGGPSPTKSPAASPLAAALEHPVGDSLAIPKYGQGKTPSPRNLTPTSHPPIHNRSKSQRMASKSSGALATTSKTRQMRSGSLPSPIITTTTESTSRRINMNSASTGATGTPKGSDIFALSSEATPELYISVFITLAPPKIQNAPTSNNSTGLPPRYSKTETILSTDKHRLCVGMTMSRLPYLTTARSLAELAAQQGAQNDDIRDRPTYVHDEVVKPLSSSGDASSIDENDSITSDQVPDDTGKCIDGVDSPGITSDNDSTPKLSSHQSLLPQGKKKNRITKGIAVPMSWLKSLHSQSICRTGSRHQENLASLYGIYSTLEDDAMSLPSSMPLDYSLGVVVRAWGPVLTIRALFLLLTNCPVVLLSSSTTLLAAALITLPELCLPFHCPHERTVCITEESLVQYCNHKYATFEMYGGNSRNAREYSRFTASTLSELLDSGLRPHLVGVHTALYRGLIPDEGGGSGRDEEVPPQGASTHGLSGSGRGEAMRHVVNLVEHSVVIDMDAGAILSDPWAVLTDFCPVPGNCPLLVALCGRVKQIRDQSILEPTLSVTGQRDVDFIREGSKELRMGMEDMEREDGDGYVMRHSYGNTAQLTPLKRPNLNLSIHIPSHSRGKPSSDDKNAPIRTPVSLDQYNEAMRWCFRCFLGDVILHAIPSSLLHHPREHIIACDVEKLFRSIPGPYQTFCQSLVDSPVFANFLARNGIVLSAGLPPQR